MLTWIGVAVAVGACGAAAQRPPEQPAAIPAAEQRFVHRAFHDLPRVCADRKGRAAALERVTTRFVGLFERYPAEGFELVIDQEGGTMLSAILVLRNELRSCAPAQARRIDTVLPVRIRTALTPLREPGGRR